MLNANEAKTSPNRLSSVVRISCPSCTPPRRNCSASNSNISPRNRKSRKSFGLLLKEILPERPKDRVKDFDIFRCRQMNFDIVMKTRRKLPAGRKRLFLKWLLGFLDFIPLMDYRARLC